MAQNMPEKELFILSGVAELDETFGPDFLRKSAAVHANMGQKLQSAEFQVHNLYLHLE